VGYSFASATAIRHYLIFFDNPEGFRPAAHAYWGLRLPWVEFADNLPHVDGYSRVRDAAIGDPRYRQKAR
jgi:hypothetical protein